MSSIEQFLQSIRTAILARTVRNDIANAIEQCYDDVHNPTLNTEAIQAAVQAKIDAGQMAALTIGDHTITAVKLANGVIPTPDTTLSQSGVPADAETVGDEIASVKADLNSVFVLSDSTLAVTWVRGSINSSGGDSTATTRARSNYITLLKGEKLTFKCGSYYFEIAKYAADGTFVSLSSSWINSDTEIINTDADYKYRFVIRNPVSSADVVIANIDCVITVQPILVSTVNGHSAEIENLSDSFEDIAYADVTGLTWTLGKNINSAGIIGSASTFAYSSSCPAAKKYLRYGDAMDMSDNALSCFICEYDSLGTFIRRGILGVTTDIYLVDDTCASVRFVFGRPSSTGIAITDNDLQTYFKVKRYSTIPNVSEAEIADINNALFGFEFVTPQIVNICGGQQMNFYYQNMIMGFNTKKAYQISPNIKATNFGYFCRLNPSSDVSLTNQGFKIQLYPYNTKKIFSSNTVSYNIVPRSSGSGLTKKVLLLGDSLTFNTPLSKHLVDDLLTGDAMGVELIGTRGTAPYMREGRSGWSPYDYTHASTVDNVTNAFWNPTTNKFDFSYYMSSNSFDRVDYVFVNLGTNVSGYDGTTVTVAEMMVQLEEIVNSIHGYDASIRVGVWTPPPKALIGNGELSNNDSTLLKVKEIIKQFSGRITERIYVVPVTLNVDPYHDFPAQSINVSARNTDFQMLVATDNTHPSDAGYFKMADVIYSYIKYFGSLDA